jgi:hypothetical protein
MYYIWNITRICKSTPVTVAWNLEATIVDMFEDGTENPVSVQAGEFD